MVFLLPAYILWNSVFLSIYLRISVASSPLWYCFMSRSFSREGTKQFIVEILSNNLLLTFCLPIFVALLTLTLSHVFTIDERFHSDYLICPGASSTLVFIDTSSCYCWDSRFLLIMYACIVLRASDHLTCEGLNVYMENWSSLQLVRIRHAILFNRGTLLFWILLDFPSLYY